MCCQITPYLSEQVIFQHPLDDLGQFQLGNIPPSCPVCEELLLVAIEKHYRDKYMNY